MEAINEIVNKKDKEVEKIRQDLINNNMEMQKQKVLKSL